MDRNRFLVRQNFWNPLTTPVGVFQPPETRPGVSRICLPKIRFEHGSGSARLNAAPHRRAPAPIPSPPTLRDGLGPGDCA